MAEINEKDLELGLNVFRLIVLYGGKAALELLNTWQEEDPDLEDIDALRSRVPSPDTYLKGVKP